MAVKQYIGARYVPKFFEYNNGEWLENTQYEPLTIVQYQGNSYTSKKEVPANIGDPSHNSEYWVSTGNYNAQVELLREELVDFEETTGNNFTDVNNKIDNRTTFAGRKFIFIGDSYNTSSVESGGWGNIIINNLGLTAGVNVWNSGHGGDNFYSGTFLAQLQAIAATLSSDEKLEITDVVLQGDINDWDFNSSTVITNYRAYDSYVHNTFPNAKSYVILCGWGASFGNDMREKCIKQYDWIYRANKFSKIYFNFQNLMLPHHMLNDLVHPNSEGLDCIVASIQNILAGGEGYIKSETMTNYFQNSNTTGSDVGIVVKGNLTHEGLHIYTQGVNSLTTPSTSPWTIPDGRGTYSQLLSIGTATYDHNFLFMKECEFICDALVMIGQGTALVDKRLRVMIQREQSGSEYIWNMKVGSLTYDSGFAISNVTAVYLFFDKNVSYYN